jgi:hypothetical protein
MRFGRWFAFALQIRRTPASKTLAVALLASSALAVGTAPALALQVIVTQVDKSSDRTMTYHFAVKTDPGETLMPGDKATADFVTVYNFYGLVDGSPKSPAGWKFSSEQFGRTPTANGYPLVSPLDVPNTPNLTWTVTKPVTGGTQIDGFAATTRVTGIVLGEYSAEATEQMPAVKDAAAGAPGAAAGAGKQAVIGTLPTPSFLASVK